jgi:hypothetical protein
MTRSGRRHSSRTACASGPRPRARPADGSRSTPASPAPSAGSPVLDRQQLGAGKNVRGSASARSAGSAAWTTSIRQCLPLGSAHETYSRYTRRRAAGPGQGAPATPSRTGPAAASRLASDAPRHRSWPPRPPIRARPASGGGRRPPSRSRPAPHSVRQPNDPASGRARGQPPPRRPVAAGGTRASAGCLSPPLVNPASACTAVMSPVGRAQAEGERVLLPRRVAERARPG